MDILDYGDLWAYQITETTVVFIARDSVDILNVYGETVANFGFIASVK